MKVVAALAICLGLASVAMHAREYWDPIRYSKDFTVDYVSARAIAHGANPYEASRTLVERDFGVSPAYANALVMPGANWHTPFHYLMTMPFTFGSLGVGGLLWLLVSAGALVAALALTGRELCWSRRMSLVVAIAALAFPVVQKDLSLGQINGELLLFLVGGWILLRRDRPVWAGMSLGVAAVIKIFPILLVIPLVAKRRWKAAASTCTTAALLGAVSVMVMHPRYLKDVFATGRANFSIFQSAPTNISWWGIADRWLAPNRWVRGLGWGHVAVLVAVAGIGALLVYAVRRFDVDDPMAFWGSFLALMLAWPVVWDHYLVLAAPLVLVLAKRALDGASPVVFAVAAGLVIGTPPGVQPLWHPAPEGQVALLYQLPTLAALAALFLVPRDRQRAPSDRRIRRIDRAQAW